MPDDAATVTCTVVIGRMHDMHARASSVGCAVSRRASDPIDQPCERSCNASVLPLSRSSVRSTEPTELHGLRRCWHEICLHHMPRVDAIPAQQNPWRTTSVTFLRSKTVHRHGPRSAPPWTMPNPIPNVMIVNATTHRSRSHCRSRVTGVRNYGMLLLRTVIAHVVTPCKG
jgi:hypothetical protein